jgi:hypothetical protein
MVARRAVSVAEIHAGGRDGSQRLATSSSYSRQAIFTPIIVDN